MKKPKTISGYLSLMKRTADLQLRDLKGYDLLTDQGQIALGGISGDIYNGIEEFNRQQKLDKQSPENTPPTSPDTTKL